MISEPQLNEALKRIQQADPRYARNAYLYAFHGLDFTMRKMLRLSEGERRHVAAHELLNGMRQCAQADFGFLARQVWESWGIRTSTDWGNIIYNLISAKLMNANEEDSIEQFRNVYTLDSAFPSAEEGLMIKPQPSDDLRGEVAELDPSDPADDQSPKDSSL